MMDRSNEPPFTGCGFVSIDGPSGAGKSSLAADLRDRFQIPVLEVGPFFRYAAWLSRVGDACSTRAAAATLTERVRRESLRCSFETSGMFAAMALSHRGRPVDEELWDPDLGPAVALASVDSVVAAYIGLTVRALLRGLPRAVVVGRNAQVFGCGGGSVGLLLDADPDVRNERKEDQLRMRHARAARLWEADTPARRSPAGYRLETSNVSRLAVADFSAQIIAANAHPYGYGAPRESQAA